MVNYNDSPFYRKFGIFIFLLLPTFLFGREVPKIIHFQRSDYQAAHQNWMITQDCQGFLFVANTGGVLIYNGFQWQKVSLPRNQKPRAVFQGNDCNIYVGGYECFGYIDMKNRNQPRYIPVADSILQHTNQEIWNIFGNGQTVLFQSFSDLFWYDYQKIEKIPLPGNLMLGSVAAGRFYVPKVENGLYEFTESINEINSANILPKNSKIAALCTAPDGENLLVGTQNHGLFLINKNSATLINSPLNDQLKQKQINKMTRLFNGDYAIGTILNGIYITDDLKTIKYHINKVNGLSNNTVLSLFEDKHKNLWVGMDKGLDLLMLSNPIDFYYDIQGKLGTVFTSIVYQNDLYLGTNQGVFVQQADGEYQLIEHSQGQIWSFLVVDGDLLCGHNAGTFKIKNNKFQQVSDVAGGWWMQPIGEKRILQATYNGLIILQKENGEWAFEKNVQNGDLLMMKFVLNGNILTGFHSNYGIGILKLSDDFTEVLDRKIIGSMDGINFTEDAQLIDNQKDVFIRQGKHFFQSKDFNFQKTDVAKWKTPLNPSTQANFRYLSIFQQMQQWEGIFASPYYQHDVGQEAYIFAIDEGYIRVPENSIFSSYETENPTIDYLMINGKLSNYSANVLKSPLELSPSENDLAVYLKAPNNIGCFPANNFEYHLKGWDDRWHPVPNDGKINFYHLKAGKYRLLVKNSNSSTVATNIYDENEIWQFSLQSHWYESWIGGLLYSGIILFLILFLNKRQERKLKKQANQLIAEQEKELESERIKSKNKTLEQELLYKSKMLANSTMTLIQKNKMLNQLKDFIQDEVRNGSVKGLKKQKIFNLIDRNINSDHDWEIFERNFAAVHKDFLDTLKTNFPDLTAGELRLAAYIRLNLSSKEIAPLLNISVRSIENKRYRLRKKMNIAKEDSLKDYLMRL